MAYSKRAVRQTYAPRRRTLRQTIYSPAHHVSFRHEWEANFEPAVQKVQSLKREGYLVEEALQRGALTESQAERIASRLKEAGYETQTIPIATWAGEKVVFLVYKPPKEPVAPAQPEPQPQPPTKQGTSPEEYLQRFLKEFYEDNDSRVPDEVMRFKNEGWAMEPHRVMAVISKDAPLKDGSDSLVGMAREFHSGQLPLASFPKANDLATALRRAKGSAKRNYGYLAVGPDMVVDINLARRALKILGPRTPVRIYCKGKERPVFFMEPDGNAVVIAPAMSVDPSTVISVSEAMKLYGSS